MFFTISTNFRQKKNPNVNTLLIMGKRFKIKDLIIPLRRMYSHTMSDMHKIILNYMSCVTEVPLYSHSIY